MMRDVLVSDTFAPFRRLGAFVVVFGGFLVAPVALTSESETVQDDGHPVVAEVMQPSPVVTSRRIEQAWRVETSLRRGDIHMAQASR